MRMGLGRGTGRGKEKGHGAKYVIKVLVQRQARSEKKCSGRRASELVRAALKCPRERADIAASQTSDKRMVEGGVGGPSTLKEGKLALKPRNLLPISRSVQTWESVSERVKALGYLSLGVTPPAGSG